MAKTKIKNSVDGESVTLVVCHDAGGAELVSSYVSRHRLTVKAVLSGPAEDIFKRKLPDVKRVSLNEGILGVALLICGTSWPTMLECEAIDKARQMGIPSVAILDHWINYRRRFERDGLVYKPDSVWVSDAWAEKIALRELPEFNIKRIDNPYRLDVIDQITAMPNKKQNKKMSILYVTEPTSVASLLLHGDENYFGYTETDALKQFMVYIDSWDDVGEIIIRPHPSEAVEKYLWACIDSRVRINASDSLLTQLADADIVVGCNSMAMVVATWVGKRVISAIPEGGGGFSLPIEGIEFINKISGV